MPPQHKELDSHLGEYTTLTIADQTTTTNQRRRLHAISLNNVGVRFLENGYYKPAHQCFKDASALIQVTFHEFSDDEAMARFEQESVSRVIRLIGNPRELGEKTAEATVLKVLTTSSISSFSFAASNNNNNLQSILKVPSSSSMSFPVLIEENSMENCHEMDRVRQGAIIMHNLGIAFMCLSKVATEVVDSEALGNNAVEVGLMSTSIFLRQQQCLQLNPAMNQGCLSLIEWLCLTIAVLCSFINTLSLHGKFRDQANKFYDLMTTMQGDAMSIQNSHHVISSTSSSSSNPSSV